MTNTENGPKDCSVENTNKKSAVRTDFYSKSNSNLNSEMNSKLDSELDSESESDDGCGNMGFEDCFDKASNIAFNLSVVKGVLEIARDALIVYVIVKWML